MAGGGAGDGWAKARARYESVSSSPILSVCHCPIGGSVRSQDAGGGALRVRSELVSLHIGTPSPSSQQWQLFDYLFNLLTHY